MKKRNVLEIFSSAQGEGVYVGARQIFIRVPGCNLSCLYCDTPHVPEKFCKVETISGTKNFLEIENPLTSAQAIELIKNFMEKIPHHALVLTGGEPLIHADFFQEIIENLHGKIKILLETNGTLCDELEKILPWIDIVSMDLKMPSILESDVWDAHQKFLKIAQKKDLYVKIVLTEKTNEEEFLKACEILKSVSEKIPLILQPVTPNQFCKKPSAQKLLNFQAMALNFGLKNVRLIPQTQDIIGNL